MFHHRLRQPTAIKDYSRFISRLLEVKYLFKHLEKRKFGSKINQIVSNFHPLEVVTRVSDTQLQQDNLAGKELQYQKLPLHRPLPITHTPPALTRSSRAWQQNPFSFRKKLFISHIQFRYYGPLFCRELFITPFLFSFIPCKIYSITISSAYRCNINGCVIRLIEGTASGWRLTGMKMY